MAGRADRYWSWSVLLPLCHLVQRAKRRYCRPLVFWARADSGRFLRVGMLIVIEAYPYLDVEHPAESHFVWFMSGADAGVLTTEFGMSNPPALGRVLLDSAIVLSQNASLCRTNWFARRGGRRGWSAGGLCSAWSDPPTGRGDATAVGPWPNDGRFFYADEPVAEGLAAALDASR